MARWRLRIPHYLNVLPETEWEQKETDLLTGKQARKVYKVPMYLDPKDPTDCNYPGEIIVCHDGKGQPRDKVFVGPPTPDMEPLDAEAEAISAAEAPNWVDPIESLTTRMEATVNQTQFAALQKQVQELTEANEQLRNAKGRRV